MMTSRVNITVDILSNYRWKDVTITTNSEEGSTIVKATKDAQKIEVYFLGDEFYGATILTVLGNYYSSGSYKTMQRAISWVKFLGLVFVASELEYASSFPYLDQTEVTPAHKAFCAFYGHAEHRYAGVTSPFCPRCAQSNRGIV